MANREETVTINVRGNAARAYREIEGAIKKARGAIDGSNESARTARRRARNLKIALAALSAAAFKLVQAFAEQEASTGRLERAFDKAGASAEDLTRAQDAVRKMQMRHGVAVNESNDALRKLIQSTGDATKATQDYALAVDLAAAEDMSVAQAADLISQARDGNVRSLQRLSGVSKDYATELQSLTNENDRAAIALQTLEENYRGAAEELEGTTDSLGAAEQASKELAVAMGEAIVEVSTFTVRIFEMITFSEEGEFSLRNIASAFGSFADQARAATQGLEDFLDEATAGEMAEFVGRGGVLGAALGSGGADIVDDVRRRAQEGRQVVIEEAKKTEKELEALEFGPTLSPEDRVEILKNREKLEAETLKAEEQAAKEAERERERRASESKRARQQRIREEERAAQEAQREAEAARREAEDRAHRERLAQMRLRGEERKALEAELEERGATEGEAQLALERFDLQRQREMEAEEARRVEIEQREQLAELKLRGQDAEAALFEIRMRNLTPLEEELAMQRLLEEQAQAQAQAADARASARETAIGAIAGGAKGLINLLAEEEAAQRSAAAIDALVYGYKAAAAFASYNIPAGIQYTVATAQAGAVAAGAGGGGGGGGGGGAPVRSAQPSSPERSALRDEQTSAALGGRDGPRESAITVNMRSVGRPTPEDARQVVDAIDRERGGRL